MDDLELLKKDWQQEKANEFHQYTENELFAMTKQKSVSVAKWVFIIGFLEICFWRILDYTFSYFIGDEEITYPDDIFSRIYNFLEIGFIAFPYLFLGMLLYLNYRMRNTENPKILIKKILLMKKAIQWNINMFIINVVVSFSLGYLTAITEEDKMENPHYWFVMAGSLMILSFMVFSFIVFLKKIYYLIYGRFIKQLEENYKELSKIEE